MARNPVSILIVDDEESLAGIIASQLSDELGYETRIVHDGREAIELLSNAAVPPSIILTDYNMPDVSGIQLLEWLRERRMEIPVIMMTAAGSDQVAAEAMKLGAYDYLRKEDLELTRLATTIKSTLERRRLRAVEQVEEERSAQTKLNESATDQVHEILTVVSPMITESVASILSGLDHLSIQVRKLEEGDRESCGLVIERMKAHANRLELALKTMLELYTVTYSHHMHLERLREMKESLPKRLEG